MHAVYVQCVAHRPTHSAGLGALVPSSKGELFSLQKWNDKLIFLATHLIYKPETGLKVHWVAICCKVPHLCWNWSHYIMIARYHTCAETDHIPLWWQGTTPVLKLITLHYIMMARWHTCVETDYITLWLQGTTPVLKLITLHYDGKVTHLSDTVLKLITLHCDCKMTPVLKLIM